MIEVITCGDLARLGGPWDRLRQHDPRAMDPAHDVLCHCHDGSHAGSAPPEDSTPVACRELSIYPLGTRLEIHLCCLCALPFADVLRVHAGEPGGRWLWIVAQAFDARSYRDQRRLDPSPVPCDMDLQAAAVLDYLEGDETP
jgi:hypothetical protein